MCIPVGLDVAINKDTCVPMYVCDLQYACVHIHTCMHACTHELELKSLFLFTVMGLVSVC